MSRYRKKPVEIDAWQLTRANLNSPLPNWIEEGRSNDILYICSTSCGIKAIIETLEGEMTAHEEDYIIRGIKGELYPCKEDIFLETYELVSPKIVKMTGDDFYGTCATYEGFADVYICPNCKSQVIADSEEPCETCGVTFEW